MCIASTNLIQTYEECKPRLVCDRPKVLFHLCINHLDLLVLWRQQHVTKAEADGTYGIDNTQTRKRGMHLP